MRLLFACALLVLCVSSGDALKCNFCSGTGISCEPTTQKCPATMDACGVMWFIEPDLGIMRSCMNMATCKNWAKSSSVIGTCCSTDNCN